MRQELSDDRRNWLTARSEELLRLHPEYKPLSDKLLSVSGEFVIMPVLEEDYKKILSRGFKQYGWNAQIRLGDPCRCHSNACELWKENHRIQIVTGYALSEDGIWRQHSWCRDIGQQVRNRGGAGLYRLIETTKKRKLYFGFVLTELEAEQFYNENCW